MGNEMPHINSTGRIMLKVFEEIRLKPIGWLKAVVYALCLAGVYYSAFARLVTFDWAIEDYSHCALVPLVVLYLLWEKRREIAATPSEPSWTGLVPFGIGVCFFWIGELGGEYFTLYMSFWFAVVGLIWLHLGWAKIKTIWFSLVMILAMFPFPNFINTRITFQLRLVSSKLGVWMLHLYGMSAYREGNVIDLGFTQLQVVDACSGLRYVMPLMVLSLLLAYWFRAHWWKRTFLFLSSIPLAIFVNSFRIAATGVLYSMFGAQVAEGFFHGFSGWLIFMFAIPCLLLEMWLLRQFHYPFLALHKMGNEIAPHRDAPSSADRESSLAVASDSLNSRFTIHDPRSTILQPKFIVAMVMLLLALGLSHGIEFRQKVPIAKPFSQFPMQIGEWKGARQGMEQQFLDILKFSDYIMVDYTDRAGKAVNFYVAYYQDQQKGESIHSPETCLPAGGWEFTEAGNVTIPVGGTASMKVNRAFIIKDNSRELVYYWFPQRGRILTNLYQLKIYTFWDSLTRQRTDGALVRVITPVMQSEKLRDAEARLQGFVGQILPVLDEYVPK
jgi:exosortase D (VPLPA-CTERM-specific)